MSLDNGHVVYLAAPFGGSTHRQTKKQIKKDARRRIKALRDLDSGDGQKVAAEYHPDRDWFTARMKAARLNQQALATAIGVRKESMGRMLTGARAVSAAEAAALAEALQSNVAEIVARLGITAMKGLAVAGRVLADGRISSVVEPDTQSLSRAEYPPDAVALVVEAPTGALAAWDGATIVYVPSKARNVGPEAVGRLCVIEDAGSALPVIGTLKQATGKGENSIEILGTKETVAAKRLVRASPVLGIRFPG